MTIADPSLRARSAPRQDSIRVMIVDDAIVVRGLLVRWIEAEVGLQVVASLRGGREAIEQVERTNPDVVILDVDMPDIDGLTALPLLFEKRRDLVVIMSSTLTRHNAEVSLKALSLGATDYIPKPESTRELTNSAAFRRDLIEKIRVLGARRRQRLSSARAVPWAVPAARPGGDSAVPARLRRVFGPDIAPASDSDGFKLRPLPAVPPRILLIGSSTGGPQALGAIVGRITGIIDQAPVLVTQHMPPTFTTILAEILERASGRPVREALDGEALRAGAIYIAPGGRHLRVVRRDGVPSAALDDGPQVNFCKPAVDPMFSSAAETWGSWNLALVLTGMGSDGTRGAADVVAAGGSVIAQDEDTSVVWGMPGAVTRAGLCSAVLPLDQIAAQLTDLFSGEPVVTPADYDYLRRLLKERSGLVLSADKQYLVESRLQPVAHRSGIATLAELVQRLRGTRNEPLATEVAEAMTTNESFFFRDKLPFDHFRDTIMPTLLAARPTQRRIRIWCAAASTGQEPYSLAMILKEMGDKVAGRQIEIVATEFSTQVLEKAKSGVFSQFEVQRGLPIQLLIRYFDQIGETWQINPDVRAMVQFRPFNLLHEFTHLGPFDLVFCRNVLIYFDHETKSRVLDRVARIMEHDGYLVLGAAETVVGLTDSFKPLPDRRGVYVPSKTAKGGKGDVRPGLRLVATAR